MKGRLYFVYRSEPIIGMPTRLERRACAFEPQPKLVLLRAVARSGHGPRMILRLDWS